MYNSWIRFNFYYVVYLLHIKIGILRDKRMKKLILLAVVLFRLLTHDGIFLSQRRVPPKPQPAEVRVAIRRPWKRGKKKFRK
jgi:hypothetical protein